MESCHDKKNQENNSLSPTLLHICVGYAAMRKASSAQNRVMNHMHLQWLNSFEIQLQLLSRPHFCVRIDNISTDTHTYTLIIHIYIFVTHIETNQC